MIIHLWFNHWDVWHWPRMWSPWQTSVKSWQWGRFEPASMKSLLLLLHCLVVVSIIIIQCSGCRGGSFTYYVRKQDVYFLVFDPSVIMVPKTEQKWSCTQNMELKNFDLEVLIGLKYQLRFAKICLNLSSSCVWIFIYMWFHSKFEVSW